MAGDFVHGEDSKKLRKRKVMVVTQEGRIKSFKFNILNS